MDRFWSMRMDYMEAEAEIALLRRGMAGLPEEIAVRFATALRRIAEKVRAAYLQVSAEHDAIEATISTRTLLRIRDLVVMFRDGIKRGIDPFQMAFAIALTNKCDDTTRTVIEEIVRLEIGDPAQAFGSQPTGTSRP
jgi:MoxR-like ATPase